MLLASIGPDMLHTIETKSDWQSIFNSLRIVSTNLISISKSIRDKKEALLRTSVVLPIAFSEDVDPELQVNILEKWSLFFCTIKKKRTKKSAVKLSIKKKKQKQTTTHRISMFNQDVIPHLLRTKLIPELEDEENSIYQSGKDFEQGKTFDVNFFESIYGFLFLGE